MYDSCNYPPYPECIEGYCVDDHTLKSISSDSDGPKPRDMGASDEADVDRLPPADRRHGQAGRGVRRPPHGADHIARHSHLRPARREALQHQPLGEQSLSLRA